MSGSGVSAVSVPTVKRTSKVVEVQTRKAMEVAEVSAWPRSPSPQGSGLLPDVPPTLDKEASRKPFPRLSDELCSLAPLPPSQVRSTAWGFMFRPSVET